MKPLATELIHEAALQSQQDGLSGQTAWLKAGPGGGVTQTWPRPSSTFGSAKQPLSGLASRICPIFLAHLLSFGSFPQIVELLGYLGS